MQNPPETCRLGHDVLTCHYEAKINAVCAISKRAYVHMAVPNTFFNTLTVCETQMPDPISFI